MTFTLELGITASPSRVFDFVADFASTPRWYSAVQRVEHVQGDGGMGTRYSVYRRLPSGPVVNVVEVIGYTQGKEVAFTSVEGPTPFTYRYRVEPTSSGARLELEGAISAIGLPGLARVLGPAAERLFKHGMQENLGVLKDLLERQPPSGRGGARASERPGKCRGSGARRAHGMTKIQALRRKKTMWCTPRDLKSDQGF